MSNESDPVEFDWGGQPTDPRTRRAGRYMPRPMIIASVLVIIALVALAIAPAILLFRGERPGKKREEAIQQGARHTAELTAAMYKETAEFRGYLLTGSFAPLGRAIEARNDEHRIIDQMDTCVAALGPVAQKHLTDLREAVKQWHSLPDSVAGGLMTPNEYRARASEQTVRRDSAFEALSLLEHELDRVAVENLHQRSVFAGQLRAVSIALGLVALSSAAVVAWFAMRQRALATGLEKAANNEARLRRIAEERRAQLERVTESRQRLMRGFTHDVKNPLGAADGYLQLMQQGLTGELSEEQKLKISRVRNSIHAALSLIDDLLELARAESGDIQLNRVNLDLRLLVEEACSEYRDLAATKGLELKVDLPPHPIMAETDPNRVRQILANLLSNAVKYTDQGSVAVRADLGQEKGVPHVTVEVTDTGPGIPPDRHEHIFQEFVRLESDLAHGAGVGLAISRRLARALNGDIRLSSVIGRGSTFILLLPVSHQEVKTNSPSQAA